jgi:hypothetical protein
MGARRAPAAAEKLPTYNTYALQLPELVEPGNLHSGFAFTKRISDKNKRLTTRSAQWRPPDDVRYFCDLVRRIHFGSCRVATIRCGLPHGVIGAVHLLVYVGNLQP